MPGVSLVAVATPGSPPPRRWLAPARPRPVGSGRGALAAGCFDAAHVLTGRPTHMPRSRVAARRGARRARRSRWRIARRMRGPRAPPPRFRRASGSTKLPVPSGFLALRARRGGPSGRLPSWTCVYSVPLRQHARAGGALDVRAPVNICWNMRCIRCPDRGAARRGPGGGGDRRRPRTLWEGRRSCRLDGEPARRPVAATLRNRGGREIPHCRSPRSATRRVVADNLGACRTCRATRIADPNDGCFAPALSARRWWRRAPPMPALRRPLVGPREAQRPVLPSMQGSIALPPAPARSNDAPSRAARRPVRGHRCLPARRGAPAAPPQTSATLRAARTWRARRTGFIGRARSPAADEGLSVPSWRAARTGCPPLFPGRAAAAARRHRRCRRVARRWPARARW